MHRLVLPILLLLALAAAPLHAAIDDYSFDTEQQAERFHTLIAELRCPKCLNSNLAGSDAPIAADLRAEIYSQVQEGRSDDEIIAYLQARYGDFILYRPPLNTGTALLWFGPLALLLAGFIVLRRLLAATRGSNTDAALSPEEQRQLQALLDDEDKPRP